MEAVGIHVPIFGSVHAKDDPRRQGNGRGSQVVGWIASNELKPSRPADRGNYIKVQPFLPERKPYFTCIFCTFGA
jgi:hypothetical protein